MFLDNIPDGNGIDHLFATHPSIEKRVAALVKFGGGRDPGRWEPPASAAFEAPFEPSGRGTSVPTTP